MSNSISHIFPSSEMIIVPFVSLTRSNLSPPSAHSRLLLVWHRLDRLCKTRLHDVHLKADSSRAVAGDRWWRASERRNRRMFKLLLTFVGFERVDQNQIGDEVKWRTPRFLIAIRAKNFSEKQSNWWCWKWREGKTSKRANGGQTILLSMGFDLYYFFKQLYGSKLNFFSVTLFLVLVVYNTQSHSDGCEIPKMKTNKSCLYRFKCVYSFVAWSVSECYSIDFFSNSFSASSLSAGSNLDAGVPSIDGKSLQVEKSLSLWVAWFCLLLCICSRGLLCFVHHFDAVL